MKRQTVNKKFFNDSYGTLPYSLRTDDFAIAMQDVYDFLFDVNTMLLGKGLDRLDDMLRHAALSGFLSDMLTNSMAKHARGLAENKHPNGHPDLIKRGQYPNNAVLAGEHGVEVKSTKRKGGAVDTHGARNEWMCVFVWQIDQETKTASKRDATRFTTIYLAEVVEADFRSNARGPLGTRTATLHKAGLKKLRAKCLYQET